MSLISGLGHALADGAQLGGEVAGEVGREAVEQEQAGSEHGGVMNGMSGGGPEIGRGVGLETPPGEGADASGLEIAGKVGTGPLSSAIDGLDSSSLGASQFNQQPSTKPFEGGPEDDVLDLSPPKRAMPLREEELITPTDTPSTESESALSQASIAME